eukprot:6190630-Pleurochrysis_carterae.AAC.1
MASKVQKSKKRLSHQANARDKTCEATRAKNGDSCARLLKVQRANERDVTPGRTIRPGMRQATAARVC